MSTFSTATRNAFLAATAMVVSYPAYAADEVQRDYLPADIIVTAERESYVGDDGSSATKTPTPLINVPQAVNVITADQLEDQGVTQLNNALRYVPGISLETGEGHRDEVFIRGQESTADFYLDGLRDDAQYYRSLYNVERLEVLKGANALIFGRGAGGGAINRVSKVAKTSDIFANAAASVDTFGAFALSGDVNSPLNDDMALRINGTYEEFDSHRDFYEGRFIGFTPTLTADLGPDTRLTASYTYDDDERVTDRGVPSFDGLPLQGYDDTFFGDPDYNFSDVEVHIARARIEHDMFDALSFNASLQYANYDKFYANLVPTGGTTATTVNLAGYESGTKRENLIGQANFIGTFETGSIGHTLLVGTEFSTSDTDSIRNQARFNSGADTSITVDLADVIAVPAFTLQPQRASTSDLRTFSFYAQEQMDIGILQLVAGIRYDEFDLESTDLVAGFDGDRVDSKWSPRFGLIVKPQEDVSIYASYAESFLPQSGDQFTVLDQLTESLKPEEFTSYEAGIKWAIRPELLLTAAIFQLERSNTRSVDPDTNLTTLVGESEVKGLEIGLAGEVVENLNVSMGYAYLDAEITDAADASTIGTPLQQVPEHHITAWARYDVTERFGFGAGVIHQTKQFASTSSSAVILPGYTRVDAAVFYDLSENVALQLNVENLFDESYYPSAHGNNNIQPAEPLNASIGARVRF